MAAEAEAEAELNAHGGGLPWQLRKPPPLPEPNWESFHMTAAVGSLRYMVRGACARPAHARALRTRAPAPEKLECRRACARHRARPCRRARA